MTGSGAPDARRTGIQPHDGGAQGGPELLLQTLAGHYDVILIDTPSAQEASDAMVIGQRAGAALIVGRRNKTKATEIAQLASVMASSNIALLGASLNEY